ncbi:MAG: hypothetical protein NTU94_05175 [Planctomycetota bacterium]|nr:hypothetical protein [Planctomycetota bacterium]
MKALKITRPLLIHAVLLVGCVVFAFPFLWLLSTSAKRNEELAVFPPRWVPEIPWYSDRSPFIDGGAYGQMKPPRSSFPPPLGSGCGLRSSRCCGGRSSRRSAPRRSRRLWE